MKYLIVVLMFFAYIVPAHAYIDAGSGSYMLQMAMAGLMALAFTIKLTWNRIATSLTGIFKNSVRPGKLQD